MSETFFAFLFLLSNQINNRLLWPTSFHDLKTNYKKLKALTKQVKQKTGERNEQTNEGKTRMQGQMKRGKLDLTTL